MLQHSKHLVYLKPHILCESNIPHFDVWKQQKFPKYDLFTIKVTDFSKSDHKNTKMNFFYHCTSAPNFCILRLLLFKFHLYLFRSTGVGQIKENCGLGNLETVNQYMPYLCVFVYGTVVTEIIVNLDTVKKKYLYYNHIFPCFCRERYLLPFENMK